MDLDKIRNKIAQFSVLLEVEGENVKQALIDKDYKKLELELHKGKSTAKALRKMIKLDR